MDDNRVCLEHPDGFLLIKPEGASDSIPFLCPVCQLSMLTADDAIIYRSHECCSLCALRWVDINHDKWKAGWRPDAEDIKNEVQRRTARRPPIRL